MFPPDMVTNLRYLQQLIVAISDEIGGLSCDEFAPALGELQRCRNLLDQAMRDLAAATAANGVWALDGFRTPGRWVALHTGLSAGAAGKVTREGSRLREMPHSHALAEQGLLHGLHIEQVIRCRTVGGEHYTEEIDERFATVAASGDLEEFATVVRRWHEHLDALAGPTDDDIPPTPTSTFSLAETIDGCWSGSLFLNPSDGAILNQAIQTRVSASLQRQHDGDPSLAALNLPALRAQALVDLCNSSLRREPGDRSIPNRHHVALTLHVRPDGTVQPHGFFPPDALCDASFYRLVLGAESEVLDLGRSTRRWDNAAGLAIRHRDHHCRFPGCDQRPGHCDIHHCHQWDNSGTTGPTNGLLLCRWHHTFIHSKHWTVQLDQHQHPIFTKADGTTHQLHSHQSNAKIE